MTSCMYFVMFDYDVKGFVYDVKGFVYDVIISI